jgi:hypothetical protein
MEQHTHIRALGLLVRGEPVEAVAQLQTNPAAEAAFASFLAHHQLLAYTGHIINDSGVEEQVPETLRDAIAVHRDKLSAKNARLAEALPRLSDGLERRGVPFILLKGLYLAKRFYGGIERRTFWDMDILVRPADVPEVHGFLGDLGYARVSTPFINDRLSRHFGHAYDYHRQGALDIDVHWKLANHPGLQFDYPGIWASRQTLQLGDTPFNALCDEQALAFLLVGILKDIERGGLRLRSLVDLYLAVSRLDPSLDWGEFFQRRAIEGTRAICVQVLVFMTAVLSLQPDEFPRMQRAVADQKPSPVTVRQLDRLLDPDRYAVAGKRWAAEVYAISRPAYAAWWAWSLPARLVLHGSANRRRKKRRRSK